MTIKWRASLKENTGRALEEWLTLVRERGPATEAERRDWLKRAHGLGTNSAWWIAERSVGKGGETDDPDAYLGAARHYVEAMFSGKRAALRPLYDRLLDLSLALGEDVKACPCQTIVPLYREHVFAQLKPATNTRIDLGVALAKYRRKLPARLVDTGGAGKGDRITHRIPITKASDIDSGVERWLRQAYELDA